MNEVFSRYGIGGVCVLLTLMVMMRVAEFLWRLKEKKENLSEQAVADLTKALCANTSELKVIEQRLRALEVVLSEFPKMKTDLRRFYSAIKEIAGDKWPAIRDEIVKGEFPV